MSRDIVSAGQVVFDDARSDPSSSDTLVVVDPNPGTVGDQDPETQRAIKTADRNNEYDTRNNAECVDCVYLSDSMSDMVYTFPKERITTPDYNKHTLGYPPSVWAKAEMLVRLYQATDIGEIEAMDADVEGQVILAAKDIMVSEGITVDEDVPEEIFTDEISECPECGELVSLEEPIESSGDGTAFGYIECSNPECEFRGREEWSHSRTTPVETRVGEPTEAYFES